MENKTKNKISTPRRSQEFFHAAIKNSYPDACDIRQPIIMGAIAPVFLADVGKDTIVCKFNRRDMIFHNKFVSDLLRFHDIPAPRTHVHAYLNTWFESYVYNPNKTLHELMNGGLSENHVFNAYSRVFELQKKISEIDPVVFTPNRFSFYKEILEMQTEPTNNVILRMYRQFFRHMSKSGRQIILHNDIHDKNILYSPETKQAYLIDLDAVSLCNENFTMLTTLQRYPLNNFWDVLDEYERVTGHKIDKNMIMASKKTMTTLKAVKAKAIQMRERML